MLTPGITGVNKSLSQHRGRWRSKAGPERGLSLTNLGWHPAKAPQS